MTELSFLIELLLHHDLPVVTKDLIASRIKEVETNLVPKSLASSINTVPSMSQPVPRTVHVVPSQAPSTLALMAKHGNIPAEEIPPPNYVAPAPEPVAVVAQTAATAAAMQSRQAAIDASIARRMDSPSGKKKF